MGKESFETAKGFDPKVYEDDGDDHDDDGNKQGKMEKKQTGWS